MDHDDVDRRSQPCHGDVRPAAELVRAARVVRHDDEEVQITVLVGLPVRVRAEQVDLQRVERLDQPPYDLVQQARREILPGPALPVLREHLTENQITAAMRLSISEAERQVAATAVRGQKGKVKQALAAALEAAGAVKVNQVESLREITGATE